MKKWEYKIAYPGNAEFADESWASTLNILGLQGWELVSHFRADTSLCGFIFKRELPEEKRIGLEVRVPTQFEEFHYEVL